MKIENNTLSIRGELSKSTVKFYTDLLKKSAKNNVKVLDLSQMTFIDSAGVAFLDIVKKSSVKIQNIPDFANKAIQTFSSDKLEEVKLPKPDNIFVKIGESYFNVTKSIFNFLLLASEIFYWSFIGIFNHKGHRKGEIIKQSIFIGVDAIGIITLLSLIIGLILALQSAAQLRQFGANIFIADLISISMVREMGPMMTAIIIAGRSGSSIASEIASMKVSEEIDALKMMAIDPIRYVVAPKFNAMSLAMPLLVTISIVIGIFGGFIIAVTYLDLSPVSYFAEVIKILKPKDLIVGISKSMTFAWIIVIIGSYHGFNVKGGSEGVGKVTTSSVVASIFAVIILDAIFSFLYLGGI